MIGFFFKCVCITPISIFLQNSEVQVTTLHQAMLENEYQSTIKHASLK